MPDKSTAAPSSTALQPAPIFMPPPKRQLPDRSRQDGRTGCTTRPQVAFPARETMLLESMSPQRFILQATDPDLGHPAFETMFVVEQPHELHALIGTDAKD